MEFPTGQPYLDAQILAKKRLDELQILCSTNQYLNNICQSDEFWRIKLEEFSSEEYQNLIGEISPRNIYFQLLIDQQALDRFHQILMLTLVQLYLNFVELSDPQGSNFRIEFHGRADNILTLNLRQEDTTPGGGGEVISGTIMYDLVNRNLIGELSVQGFPEETFPARAIVANFFRSEVQP